MSQTKKTGAANLCDDFVVNPVGTLHPVDADRLVPCVPLRVCNAAVVDLPGLVIEPDGDECRIRHQSLAAGLETMEAFHGQDVFRRIVSEVPLSKIPQVTDPLEFFQ